MSAGCKSSLGACPPIDRDEVLSNEQTFTTWAYADASSVVRAAPSSKASPVGVLHAVTEDGLPEVYVVLCDEVLPPSRTGAPETWAEIRLPTRTPGQTGWVARSALSDYTRVNTELVVSRASHRLWLYRAGVPIFETSIGVGRRTAPTPAGHFWIREAFPVAQRAVGAYGPYAFGTSAYSVFPDWPGGGVVGIHGTSTPHVGPSSAGCITMPDVDIMRLATLVPLGTPLLIE